MWFWRPSRCSTHLSTTLKRTQTKGVVMVWLLLPLDHTTSPCMWLLKNYSGQSYTLLNPHSKNCLVEAKVSSRPQTALTLSTLISSHSCSKFLCSGIPQHWNLQYVHFVCVLETNKLICGLPNLLMLFLSFPAFSHFFVFWLEQAESKKIMHKSKLLYKMIIFDIWIFLGGGEAVYFGLLSSAQHRKPHVGFIFVWGREEYYKISRFKMLGNEEFSLLTLQSGYWESSQVCTANSPWYSD